MPSIYVSNATFFSKCLAAFANADATVVTQAGIDASGEADGYLSKRFALPLIAPFDTGLCLKVFDIMQFNVAAQVGFRPASGQNELIELKHKLAIDWMKDLARGLIELPLQVDSTPQVDEEGTLAASGRKLDWSMTTGGRGPRDEDFL